MDAVVKSTINALAGSLNGYELVTKKDSPFEMIVDGVPEFTDKLKEYASEIKEFCLNSLRDTSMLIGIIDEIFDNMMGNEDEYLEEYMKGEIPNIPEFESYLQNTRRKRVRETSYDASFKTLSIDKEYASEILELTDKVVEDNYPLASIFTDAISNTADFEIFRQVIEARFANDPMFFKYLNSASPMDIFKLYTILSVMIDYDTYPAYGSYRVFVNAISNVRELVENKAKEYIDIKDKIINDSIAVYFNGNRTLFVSDIMQELLEVSTIESFFGALDRKETITTSEYMENAKIYENEFNSKRVKEKEARLAKIAIKARDIYIREFSRYLQNKGMNTQLVSDFVLSLEPGVIVDHIKVVEKFMDNIVYNGYGLYPAIYKDFINEYRRLAPVSDKEKEEAIDRSFMYAFTNAILRSVEIVKA